MGKWVQDKMQEGEMAKAEMTPWPYDRRAKGLNLKMAKGLGAKGQWAKWFNCQMGKGHKG